MKWSPERPWASEVGRGDGVSGVRRSSLGEERWRSHVLGRVQRVCVGEPEWWCSGTCLTCRRRRLRSARARFRLTGVARVEGGFGPELRLTDISVSESGTRGGEKNDG